jgi:hypothetical protein
MVLTLQRASRNYLQTGTVKDILLSQEQAKIHVICVKKNMERQRLRSGF